MLPRALRLIRISMTLAILVVAAVVAVVLWDYYTASPWTRNGQVRAQVVNIAPRVSGQIQKVNVKDNQFVHSGDVLYEIDPFDFKVDLEAAQAKVAEEKADLEFRQAQFMRRQDIPGIAVSVEEKQQFRAEAALAKARFDAAEAQLRQAQINLDRTKVRSTIDGYVNNLTMLPGDYATAGKQNIQIVDSGSYWVDGYFEETKLKRLHIGEPVRVDLMGYHVPVFGRIERITRGIAIDNAALSTQGLPAVDPVYTWVRLAQRVPVRVKLEKIPDNITLVAGTTATVSIVSEEGRRHHMSTKDALEHLGDDLRHMTGR